jgi:hypothetical protein
LQDWHSTNEDDLLSQFPSVKDWWLAHQSRLPLVGSTPEFHLGFLARSLQAPNFRRCKIWADGIERLVDFGSPFLENILVTDALASNLKTSLTDIYGKLAESALLHGDGAKAHAALKILADKTELAAFRFLSAFIAFNMNDLNTCVCECELVTEPFAPIYTLLGQALLESGNTSDAIDALKVAVSVAPSDPLPRVQLIKAYLVSGLQIEAMRQVDHCRNILGSHVEIECLAAMTILSGDIRNHDFNERTLSAFLHHMEQHPDDLEGFNIAIDLAIALNDREWAGRLAGILNVSQNTSHTRLAVIISATLKKTLERQWHDLSRRLIDKSLRVTQKSGELLRQ